MKMYTIIVWMLFPFFVFSQNKFIAHRGASSIRPENTLAAFEKAIELGVGFIELDLQLSKDDSIMVIHDDDLDRTSNGSGKVNQFTYQQLRNLSAGYPHKFGPEFQNEKIPSFFEVLKLAKGKVKVCIDLKTTAEMPVMQMVEKMNMEKQVFFMSYNVDKLKRIKTIDPWAKTILIKNTLTSVDLEVASEIDACGVSTGYLSPLSLVNKAHDKGLQFWVGVISDPAKAQRLLSNGVDALFTDFPQLMTMGTEKVVFVSPNPFHEFVSILLKNPEKVHDVFIIDKQGCIVKKFSKPFDFPLIWQPLNSTSKGVYLVYVVLSDQIIFEKIVFY